MASKYDTYSELLFGTKNNQSGNNLSSNQNKINNYRARIAAAGIDPDEETDKRNWFEKWTNLPQNQNFLFDAFELLDRPRQALFSGVNNLVTDEGTFGEGLKEGIKGNNVSAKEILQNWTGSDLGDVKYEDLVEQGENPGLKTLLKSINPIDIIGFAGDTMLDPMELLGVNDALFKGVGKGIKGLAKGSDTLIEKGLQHLDEVKGVLDKEGNLIKLGYNNPTAKSAANLSKFAQDALQDSNKVLGRLERYKAFKNDITNKFKLANEAVQAIRTGRKNDFLQDVARKELGELSQEATNKIETFAKLNNITTDEAGTLLGVYLESKASNRDVGLGDFLKQAINGNLDTRNFTQDEIVNTLNKFKANNILPEAESVLDLSVDFGKSGKLKLGSGWEQLYKNAEFEDLDALKAGLTNAIKNGDEAEAIRLTKAIDDNRLIATEAYTDADRRLLKRLDDLYNDPNTGFKQLVDDVGGEVRQHTLSNVKSKDIVSGSSTITPTDEGSIYLTKGQEAVLNPETTWHGENAYGVRRNIDKGGKFEEGRYYTSTNRSTGEGYAYSKEYGENPPINLATSKNTEGLLSSQEFRKLNKKVQKEGLESLTKEELQAYNRTRDAGLFYNRLYLENGIPPEAVEIVDANGKTWSTLDYNNKVASKAYKSLPEEVIEKLKKAVPENYRLHYFDDTGINTFRENILKDDDLVKELQKYGIHIEDADFPNVDAAKSTKFYNGYYKTKSGNIDLDNLYNIVTRVDEGADFGKAVDDVTDLRRVTTDQIMDNINKNAKTGRGPQTQVVRMQGISDNTSKGYGRGDNIILREDIAKNWDNMAPVRGSGDFFDLENNARIAENPIKSVNDRALEILDRRQGTNIAGKYTATGNADYVMPHTLTEEGEAIIEDLNNMIGSKQTRGNTHLVDSRKWLGSSREINNKVNTMLKENYDNLTPRLKKFYDSNAKFMEENYIKAFNNRWLSENGMTKLAKDTQNANEVLLNQTFGNLKDMSAEQNKLKVASELGNQQGIKEATDKLNKLYENSGIKPLTNFDNKVPTGYKRVTNAEAQDMVDKFIKLNSQVGLDENKSGFASIRKFLQSHNGDIAMDENILDMFRIISDEKEISSVGKLYDAFLNKFKTWKTASPTFLLNNIFGNGSNLGLSGIPLNERLDLYTQAIDIMQNGETLSNARLVGRTLSADEKFIADAWEDYQKMGFNKAAYRLNELSDETQKMFTSGKKATFKKGTDYITKSIPYINNVANQELDTMARLAVYLKASSDPKYMKKLGVSTVEDAIKRVMFDPDMLTKFEKTRMKKLMPFYTYSKNNLMYHITNMQNNGSKYTRLVRTVKTLQRNATGGNEQDMEDYIKDNLYLPIPVKDADGNYSVLRTSLPFGNVLEFASSPGNALLNLVTPAVKSPLELALNKEAYTGREIESFPGQKSNQLPFLTKKQQKILSDTVGLDVPAKTVSRFVEGTSSGGLSGGLQNMLTIQSNVNTDRLNRSYEQIEDLQNLMKQYEQKGVEFSTINELKKANKNGTIEGLDALFNKYGIETNSSSKKSRYDEYSDLLFK